jgi:hypothetical protein
MHRLTRYIAGWVIATALATGVSWVAIQNLVTTAALSQPVPVLAAEPISIATTAPRAAVTTPAPRVTGSAHRSTSARPSGARTPRKSAGAGPSAAAGNNKPSPEPTPTKAPTVSGYSMKGGQVVLELRPDSVELVSAIPAEGYRTETWKTDYWIRVDFVGDAGSSSVIASWYEHEPTVQQTEF